MKSKLFSSAFLTAIMISGLILASALYFDTVKASTEVTGIIRSNTTWTKANSPYNLTGNVLVSKGATLTIEAGVTVNFYRHTLQVNGTLKVQGTPNNNVVFVSTNREITDANDYLANINFGDDSIGCIIENAIFSTMALSYHNCQNSIIINNNTFSEGSASLIHSGGSIGVTPVIGGSGTATITNNTFTNGMRVACQAVIINNTFIGTGLEVSDGSFMILNNTFTGDSGDDFGISLNYGSYGSSGAQAVISDNYISNFYEACIKIEWASAWIQRNIIQNKPYKTGPLFGIEIAGSSPIIENNTIMGCGIGIAVYDTAIKSKPTITNNNIYNNRDYTLFLGYPERSGYNNLDYIAGNIDAANNWWGTADNQEINQTIHDSKSQGNLGTVNFAPFLTTLNSQAKPNPDAATPTIQQIPTSKFLLATKDSGGQVELTVNGNLTITLNSKAKVTTNQATATTNVSFTVTADERLNGFINVTIPKSAVPYGTTPIIYFDNQQAQDQGYTQDSDNYYVWCTTHFNSYFIGDLTIVFASSPIIVTLIIIVVATITIAVAAVLFLYSKKRKH